MLRIFIKLIKNITYTYVLRSISAAIILRKISNPVVTLPGYKNIRTPPIFGRHSSKSHLSYFHAHTSEAHHS